MLAQALMVMCLANGWAPAASFQIDYAAHTVVDPTGKASYAPVTFDDKQVRWTWRDAEIPLVYGYTLDRASGKLAVAIYLPNTSPPIERSVGRCRATQKAG
jgi:hypothetical protein